MLATILKLIGAIPYLQTNLSIALLSVESTNGIWFGILTPFPTNTRLEALLLEGVC